MTSDEMRQTFGCAWFAMRPPSTTMKYIPSLDGERGPEVHFSFA